MAQNLILIDANSAISRWFYAVKPITAPGGEPVNALYGLFASFKRWAREYKPHSVCAAFDLRPPTFRHGIYPEYKAGRRPMPEELAAQLPLVKQALDCLGVKRAEVQGFEADDILATLARLGEESGFFVTIITGDRDAFCLINQNVRVARLANGGIKLCDTQYLLTEYGLSPAQMTQLKALMGDKSDNIPGVRGIGEVGGTKLIKQFGSVEGVYANLGSIEPPSLRNKLEAGVHDAVLSLELGTIRRDAPLDFGITQTEWHGADKPRLAEFLERYGLSRFKKDWGCD